MRLWPVVLFVLCACNPFAPEEPRLKVWTDRLPDSLMQLSPAYWTGVVFRARQTPPDSTLWTLDWLDADMRIDAGMATPGDEVAEVLYVLKEGFSCFIMFVAWGPRVRADTAVWVQFR